MQLQKEKAAFDAKSVEIIAVSTDPPDQLAKAKKAAGAEFPFASDPGGVLLDLFNARHVGGHPFEKRDIARAASVLLDNEGKILWSHYTENYRVRPEPSEILASAPGP